MGVGGCAADDPGYDGGCFGLESGYGPQDVLVERAKVYSGVGTRLTQQLAAEFGHDAWAGAGVRSVVDAADGGQVACLPFGVERAAYGIPGVVLACWHGRVREWAGRKH